MKKVIAIMCLITLVFCACKKDRVCSCTVIKTGTSTTKAKGSLVLFAGFSTNIADTTITTNVTEVQVIEKEMKEVSKKTAKNNCISYTEPYSETIPTSVPSTSFNLSIVVENKGEKKYDCELK